MNQVKQYFGTDGIRGRVGGESINPEFVLKLGWAAGKVLAREGCNRVVIGKDTRISGYMFESALEAGFSAAGVDVYLTGPIPTPAIAYLTRTLHACAGVVISASHNPHYDNGIKFFDADGHKLSDADELAIEAMLEQPLLTVDSSQLGKARRLESADGRYIEFCKSSVPYGFSLSGLKIVIDCAHGAAYRVAPAVMHELGAEVIAMGDEPDGFNINRDCGATSPQALSKAVLEHGADLGIALDGDADRVVMADENGNIVDGDRIVYMIARSRLRTGHMRGPVVGTLMSNMGLEQAINTLDLDFIRVGVGDRHIMHCLNIESGILGGESSGHIICLDKTTTGDGVIAALQVLHSMRGEGCSLSELGRGMSIFPQVMVNVSVPGIIRSNQLAATDGLVIEAEKQLNGNGRVLLRPSGTEPVIRVMVEGKDHDLIQQVADSLASQVSAVL